MRAAAEAEPGAGGAVTPGGHNRPTRFIILSSNEVYTVGTLRFEKFIGLDADPCLAHP